MDRVEGDVRVWRWYRVRPLCLLILVISVPVARGQELQERQAAEQMQRLEGEAILALADAALDGRQVPADFRVHWENEFLKAQRGTFIPFTVTIDASGLTRAAVLVYVRAVRRDRGAASAMRERTRAVPGRPPRERRDPPVPGEFPVDVIFPVDLEVEPGQRVRVRRGFSLPPGPYDVVLVVRERPDAEGGGPPPGAAVLTQPLEVPDLTAELTTSSIILADRLEILDQPIEPDELPERPYVIGRHAITPAADRVFRRTEELIVLFLIYNPFVTSERKFDLQVEYHFFRKGVGPAQPAQAAGDRPPAQERERYFNHTDPQRFNPAILGPGFDPASGSPVMAGQGVPMAGFEAGEYRLAIRITDLLAGKSIMRDVHFTVGS